MADSDYKVVPKELNPDLTDFETTLKRVSQSKFGKVLYVNSDGKLAEANLFRTLYEKIKGLLHFRDGTNRILIQETTIKFLEEGKKWLTPEELKQDVPLLIQRVGLVLSDSKSVKQHSKLLDVIYKLSKEILYSTEEPEKQLPSSQSEETSGTSEYPNILSQEPDPASTVPPFKVLLPESFPVLHILGPPTTEKILVHIHGDSFAKETEAEGENATTVVEYVKNFLTGLSEAQIASIFGQEERQKPKQLVDLLDCAICCNSIQEQENLVHAATDLKKQLKERLEKGESCLLMGGWAGSPSGHAIYYEMIPQRNGQFTFRAYDRGAGVGYQQGATVFQDNDIPKLLYPAFVEINDIKAEDLLDEVTLRAFIELNQNQVVPGTKLSTNYSAIDLQRVIKLLKGKEAPLDLEMEELMNTQYSGLCTFKSLSAFLRQHLSLTQYQRFIFSLKYQSFWDYTNHQLATIKIPSTEYELYSKSFESFSHALRRAKELETITSEEHDIYVCQLASVELALEKRKKTAFEEIAASARTAPTANHSSSPWKTLAKLDIPPPIPLTPTLTFAVTNPKALSSLAISLLDSVQNTKDIVDSLQKIKQKFQEAYNQGQHDQVVKAYRELIRRLPFPSAQNDPNDMWQQMAKTNSQEAVKALCEIAELHEMFSSSLMQSQQGMTGALDPEVFVDTYTTICIIDDILVHAKPEDTGMLGINPLPDYRALSIFLGKPIRSKHVSAEKIEKKLKRNFTFQLKDPLQRAKLEALYDYLETRAKETGAGVDQPFAFESRREHPFTFTSAFTKKDIAANRPLNPEFEYFAKIYKDPKLFEKFSLMKSKYCSNKKFEETSSFGLIGAMASDEGSQPDFSLRWNPIFRYWRQVNADAKQILMGHVIPLLKGGFRNFQSSHLASIYTLDEKKKYTLWHDCKIFHFLDKYRPKGFFHQAMEWTADELCPIVPPEEKFRFNFRPIEDQNLKKILAFLEKHPNLSENDVMMLQRPVGADGEAIDMSIEEFRELLLLATNKPLQIDCLVAHYSQNRSALREVDTQTFFKLLFFEHDVLSTALIKRPELYESVMSFSKEGYKAAKLNGDIQTCMFYLNLSKQVKKEFLYLLKSQQDKEWLARAEKGSSYPSVDGLVEIKGLLENASFSDQQRSVLFINLIALCSSIDIVEDDSDLLSLLMEGLGHLNRHPLSAKNEDPELTREFDHSMDSIEGKIETALQNHPQKIFQNLCKRDPALVKLISKKRWKTAYPFCQSTDGQFQLNVKTGLVAVNGRAQTSIPAQLLPQLPQDSYRRGTPVMATGFNHLEFTDINGQQIRLTVNLDSTKVTQVERTTKNGQVLRLIPPLQAPAQVISDCQFWLDDKTHQCFATKGAKEGYLPLYCYELDRKTKEIKTIERLSSKPQESGYVIQDISKSDFKWLETVEPQKHILLSGTKGGSPRLLEFPRLGLRFEVTKKQDGKSVWMCNQRPGFYLAHPQHAEVLEKLGIKHYLLLQNDEGKQELLMPVRQHEKTETSDGYYRYEYNLSPSGDERHMRGLSSEANLYLAYQALCSRLPEGYSIAHALLRPQLSVDPKPKDQALKIASWIVELNGIIKDFDPRAVACRLQAAHLCELMQKAHKLTGHSSKIEIEKTYWNFLAHDLECYIQKIKRTGAFRLEESFTHELLKLASYHQSLEGRSLGPLSTLYLDSLESNGSSRSLNGLMRKRIDGSKILKTTMTIEIQREFSVKLQKAMKQDISKIPDSFLYTRPNEAMAHLFLHFLPHALEEENDPKKRELRRFLEVAREDNNDLSKYLRCALEEICNNPHTYQELINQKTYSDDYISHLIDKVIKPALRAADRGLEEEAKEKVLFLERKGARRLLSPISHTTSRSPNSLVATTALPKTIREAKEIDLKSYVEGVDEKRNNTLLDYTKKKLETLFTPLNARKGLEAKEFSCKRSDIGSYSKSESERPSKTEQLRDEAIPELMNQLENLVLYRRQKEIAMREQILGAVNQGFYNGVSHTEYVALRLAREHQTLSMNDLLLIHGRKEHHLLVGKDKEKEKLFFNELKAYLDYANHTQKYARGLELLKSWQEEPISEKGSRQLIKDSAYEALKTEPCYDTKKHPERQVIEHLLNLSIRPEQVKAFELLDKGIANKPGVIIEAVPGFGKTTLIMPLYSLLRADGDNLSLIIVPDQMVEWISDELKSKIGPSFDIWLRSLNIEAADGLDLEKLNETHDFLEEVRKKKQALIIGTKTAHCLNIQSDKALIKCCKGDSNQEQLKKLLDITTLFEEKSLPIGDEFHVFFNTRSEVNSPSGMPFSLPEEEQLLLVTLYDTLLTDPEIRTLFHFDFASEGMASTSKAEPFTEEVYQEKAKKRIVDCLLSQLKEKPLENTPKASILHQYMSCLNDQEIDLLRIYLLSEKDSKQYEKAYTFFEGIQEPIASNVLHLLAEELETLLPYSLKKKCDEGYSLSGRTATPSENGVPKIGSEFGNPHETANYSIQAAIKHGIPPDIIKQRIKELQESILKGLEKKGDLTKIPAYSSFLELSVKNKDRNPLQLSQEDIEAMIKEINNCQKTRREFTLNYILPGIRFHVSNYNSNCYRLARLMPKMRGVTGTLQENYPYSDHFAVISSRGALGRSLFTLYSHCLTQNEKGVIEVPNVAIADDESPAPLLEIIQSRLELGEKVRMVTDAGGYLNGCDIELVTKEWLKELQGCDKTVAGVCYHQNEKPVIYESSSKETNPFQSSELKPVDRFTVLLQPYVTGTDTKQGNKIVEIVTVGRNTTLSLLIQAAWRARQINAGQRVHFVISKDVEVILRKTLQIPQDKAIKLDELILFTFQNQIDSLGLDNISGARLQMQEYVQHEIYRAIKDCRKKNVSYDDLLIPEVASLFEFPMPREARMLYSGKSEIVETEKVLQKDAERILAQFKEVWKKSPTLQRSVDLKTVEKKLKGFINLDIIPEKSETRESKIGTQVTVEANVSKEQKKDQQKELQKNLEIKKLSKLPKTWLHLPWAKEPTSSYSLYTTTTRVRVQKKAEEVFTHKQNVLEKGMKAMFAALWPTNQRPDQSQSNDRLACVAQNTLASVEDPLQTELHQKAYCLEVGEFFESSQDEFTKNFSSVWHKNLKVSYNVATVQSQKSTDYVAQPFDWAQKQTPFVLVKRDCNTKKWEINLLDQEDAKLFLDQLIKNRNSMISQGWEVVLYNLPSQKIVTEGPGNLSETVINESEEAAMLLAQAKFFNGSVHYTAKEKEQLRLWAKQQGTEKILELFEKVITKNRVHQKQLVKKMNKLLTKGG